jgi:fructoselysine 6-phosphate deglycase
VFASVSGATKETFHAAKLARGRADTTVAFTKFDTSPLAGCCNKAFLVGTAQREFLAIFMLMHAFVGGLLEKREEWELLPKLLSSLKAFGPAVASDATKPLQGEDEDADFLEKNDHIYFVGCGAGDLLGGSFGRCILTEMLECQVHPITAGDFFFSTLEIIGKETPVVLILNEDRGLEYMQRIERFCRRYSVRTRVVDARDFTMSGIDTEIRPIVGPYLLGEYLVRIVVPSLVVKRGKPLSERNYIGKVGLLTPAALRSADRSRPSDVGKLDQQLDGALRD